MADTSFFPNRAAVQIQAVWDQNGNNQFDKGDAGGVYTCSGAMVSSFEVLTAAHCLFDSDLGGYADFVYVHPGRDSRYDRPYGEAEGTEWVVPSSYQRGYQNADWDLGIIALDRNVGNFTGWFGYGAMTNHMGFSGSDIYDLQLIHYPADFEDAAGVDYVGVEQQYGSVRRFVQFLDTQRFFGISDVLGNGPSLPQNMSEIWTAHGSSGSPLFTSSYEFDNTIVAVLSSGDEIAVGEKGVDVYSRLTVPKVNWIREQLERFSKPTDKAVLLNYDSWFKTTQSSVNDSTPVVGQSLSVQAKIFNGGTADAKNVLVRFRISNDSDYDDTDELLGDVVIPSIAALNTGTARLNFVMPASKQGRRYLVWTTDPKNTISEFDAPFQDHSVSCRKIASDTLCESGHRRHGSIAIDLADDSYEENDSASQAYSLPMGQWLSEGLGLGRQFDSDWYNINVPAGQLEVTTKLLFDHSLGDIDLSLFDTAGNQLQSSTSTTDDESISLTVPSAGTYRLRVYFDDAGNEYDLRWDAKRPADLAPSSISVSASEKLAGQKINIDVEVANHGGTAGEFNVVAYLSSDASVTTDDRRLGSVKVTSVDSNSVSTSVMSVNLPQPGDAFWSSNGTYFIGIFIDPTNEIAESDESNNSDAREGIGTIPINVTVHRPGTFQVIERDIENRIVVPQFDSTMGELTKVVVAVNGNGFSEPAGGFNCFQCPSPVHAISLPIGPIVLSGAAIPLIPFISPADHFHQLIVGGGREFSGAELAPFQSSGQEWSLPYGATTSLEFQHAHAIESLNFTTTTSFFFTPPKAELVASGITLSQTDLMASESFDVDFSIENRGPGRSSPFSVRVVMSADATIDPNDTTLSTIAVEDFLDPEEVINISKTIRLTHPGESVWSGDGTYYLGLIIDSKNEIDESDESNNFDQGVGLDKEAINVIVHAPGTFSKNANFTNEVRLPAFDTSLGTLTQVDVTGYFFGGNTNVAGVNCATCFHTHTLPFAMGPLSFVGFAVPTPSPSLHILAPTLPLSRVTLRDSDLAPFMSGEQRFTLPSGDSSSTDFGHAHSIAAGTFRVETVFHYERRADLRASTITTSSPLIPGRAASLTLEVDNIGLVVADPTQLEVVLANGYGEQLVLTRVDVPLIEPDGTSTIDDVQIELPWDDDPFWISSQDYRVFVRVDSANGVIESNEDNNTDLDNTTLGGTIVRGVPDDVTILPESDFIDLTELELASSDRWFTFQAQRTGPMTVEAVGQESDDLRLSVYSGDVPDQPSADDLSLVARTTSDRGSVRFQIEVDQGEVYLLRLSGNSTTAELHIGNRMERVNDQLTVHGGDGDDSFLVIDGASPVVLVNQSAYSIEGATTLVLAGGSGSDHYEVTPLSSVIIEVIDDPNGENIVEIDGRGTNASTRESETTLETENRGTISFAGVLSARMVNVGSWTNPMQRYDVNNDFVVSALDALVVINALAAHYGELPDISDGFLTRGFWDVTLDGSVTALDALNVINYLGRNRQNSKLSGNEFVLQTSDLRDEVVTLDSIWRDVTTADHDHFSFDEVAMFDVKDPLRTQPVTSRAWVQSVRAIRELSSTDAENSDSKIGEVSLDLEKIDASFATF